MLKALHAYQFIQRSYVHSFISQVTGGAVLGSRYGNMALQWCRFGDWSFGDFFS